jgi:hypothetical protein
LYHFSEENTQQAIQNRLYFAKKLTEAFKNPKTYFKARNVLLTQDRVKRRFSRMIPFSISGRNGLFI